MNTEPDGLFVYGTLRSGGRLATWLDRTSPEGRIRAWVPGRLFHLPREGFPALVAAPAPSDPPPGPGWVRGEFVGYVSDEALESALQDLDPLEGLEEGLFERRVLPVLLESGHRFGAWVYVFPPERLSRLEREAVELTEGDWESYLD